MANKKNKVKFGLTNVHYAKINDWVTDASGANLTPVYVDPVRLPGAVSISIDANGENENFYADDIVYYVISNNSGYEGDLEIALIPTDFSTDILGEILDSNGVLVERNDDEVSQSPLRSAERRVGVDLPPLPVAQRQRVALPGDDLRGHVELRSLALLLHGAASRREQQKHSEEICCASFHRVVHFSFSL